MAVEIEAKFRLRDPEALRQKLAAVGATPLGEVLEHNTYFDTPDARLRRSDCGLRIRITETPGRDSRAVLTYKGPRRPGELKIRSEQEMPLESPETAAAILDGLGYRRVFAFQKRRASFRLAGARVELDELPELGFFLEIEADDEAAVQQVRRRLGLGDEPTIPTSYIAMVADHLAASKGPDVRELKF